MDTATISAFVFIDSLVVSASQDAGSYATSRQNNLELYLGSHTCWLSYFTLVCLWCGRTVGRSVYGHVITKFSRMGSLPHFLTHGAPLRSIRARELRYYASHSFTNEVNWSRALNLKLNSSISVQGWAEIKTT